MKRTRWRADRLEVRRMGEMEDTFIYNTQHLAISGRHTGTMREGGGSGDSNSLIQCSTIL